ncbi:MAG: glycine--tRNA ligase [Acidilobaceae archaeon]
MSGPDLFEKIADLAKRRGFFWQSFEIYGGVSGFYDLGPYGVLLKNKILDKWREFFIKRHQEYVVEIESPIVAPNTVFEASGHVKHFIDPIVSCLKCGRKFRADLLIEEALGANAEGLSLDELTRIIRENNLKCPVDGGELSEARYFNLLFKTTIGPYEDNVGYLRPELAQGMFVAFKRVYEAMRGRLPLGIAQIGRVMRNEISPRQAMIRLREFTIAEMEYFFDPRDEEGSCPFFEKVRKEKIKVLTYEAKTRGENPKWMTLEEAVETGSIINRCLAYWMYIGRVFAESLGISPENIVFVEKGPHERAHYSRQTFDEMVKVSRWGWVEIAGHAYRGDYDLSMHMLYSKADLTVFRPYNEAKVIRKKKIAVDKKTLGKMYREKLGEVLKIVESLKAEEVEDKIVKGEDLIIEGYRLPASALSVVIEEEKVYGDKIVPHVVEPSFGVERLIYVTMEYAYREKEGRVIMAFPRDIAPVQAAVFPLLENEPSLIAKARELYELLVREGFSVIYDDSGSIGRRYARADEIGIPAAFTIDFQTLEDGTVTMRDRDSWKQVRVSLQIAPQALREFLRGSKIEDLGPIYEKSENDH